ncbi:RNA-binding domain-containing protein [Methanoplanus endosymbiosus]|uniref:DNA binding domain-containing protein n=1 Tax=Methanoplanus endosymbiosus TaxID=33865 RepID=A0A9E7PNX9_9EURY|nr:RNA-binding domain-containing protein [Methanoplanus endosymbiosus]UUX92196.1 putative DNA binding domain-containing protein [Methanoplanus endosymbiosus]
MLSGELLEIIKNGENSGVEFKRDDVRPESLAKEIAAMANFQGGHVILGVEDDGSISGLKRGDTEEWVMNVISRRVHPVILPYYEEITVNGKRVAVITFPPGISKPYVVREGGNEKIFIRVGSTSRPATREQQMRLFELGGILHTETMPVPGTDMSCLDKVRIVNYLKEIIHDPDIPQTEEEWHSRLLGLGFLTEASGSTYCTIAGLVLFGKTPRKYLKQAGIRVFAFKGRDKEYDALMDDILDGPLVGRFDFDDSGKTLLDRGLIERFTEAIKPFISKEEPGIDENFRRTKQWLWPYDAVREVVINALAHRDWTRFVEIEVGIYSDRFELISPGSLPNSMTIEKMIAGQRSPRNTIIVEVLRDYGYVDYRGMGIRTKVIPLMKKINGTKPLFENTEDYLKTILYRKKE